MELDRDESDGVTKPSTSASTPTRYDGLLAAVLVSVSLFVVPPT